MIDHLLRFTDEATAKAALPPSYRTQAGDWRDDFCIPGVTPYTAAADDTRTYFPGWFILVALPAIDGTLQSLPGNACRLIADRGAASILYVAPDLDPATVAAARIEPTFAGSGYR